MGPKEPDGCVVLVEYIKPSLEASLFVSWVYM